MYDRSLSVAITKRFNSGKAIILIGPRQVGKTTLIKNLLKNEPYLFLNGDDTTVRTLLSNINTEQLRTLIGNNTTVFIDEAQRINNIGLSLKIITDQFQHVKLLVSGSSAFELSSQLNEPLTGRKWEFKLFPISWEEYENHHGYLNALQQLENRIIYGFYPEVLNNPGDEKEILNQLTSSYLFKDILSLGEIRKPEILDKLVLALALQVGNKVSYNELSQLVQVDKNTVSKYIDLLVQTYVIFRLKSFSRNLRNEIKTNQKIYFYDNGLRNAIIGNFNNLELRTDKGALWENFLIAERVKQHHYKNTFARTYFWRTKQQQEVDLVEIRAEDITGFEFKWTGKKRVKLPKTFTKTYNATEHIVSKENFREFVLLNI